MFQIFSLKLKAQSSFLETLKEGDSLVIYQCHVDTLQGHVIMSGGQQLNVSKAPGTITEKFVLIKTLSGYHITYYLSELTVFPNRRFSGLKIREKSYWHFTMVSAKDTSEAGVHALVLLEKKGREATEYDFIVSAYTRNQIIFKTQKKYRQLVYAHAFRIASLLRFVN